MKNAALCAGSKRTLGSARARSSPATVFWSPAAAAVCCGLVCAVIYPVLATSDAVWGAVCVSTLVKALLIAVCFFMIPAYRTPAQKMEMERLRAEGAVPAELQALMQLEERMKDLRRDV